MNINPDTLHIYNRYNASDIDKFVVICTKQNYQLELIKKFYPKIDASSFFKNYMDHIYATQSFCFLLDFVNLHNPNLVDKLSEPVIENHSNRLILGNHSLKQLNIISECIKQTKLSSVVNLLNCCITPMGQEDLNIIY